MVAFFKTQTAEYLVAARDAEGLSNPEIEELVRDRQLNQHVLARWRKYLRESKATASRYSGSGMPPRRFRRRSSRRSGPTCAEPSRNAPVIEAELDAKPIASLRDLAEAYAAVLAKHDRAEPFGDPDGRAASRRRSRTEVSGRCAARGVRADLHRGRQQQHALHSRSVQHDARAGGL